MLHVVLCSFSLCSVPLLYVWFGLKFVLFGLCLYKYPHTYRCGSTCKISNWLLLIIEIPYLVGQSQTA